MSKKIALLLIRCIYSAISFSQTNMFPDTGNVGIGTITPKAKLDVSGAILLRSPGGNTMSRPPVGASRIAGEIAAYSINGIAYDDGLLRLSAGGGTNSFVKSFIDLSGYSTDPDMKTNIVFGTGGTERMRITKMGNIGIGTSLPTEKLSVNGNIRAQEIKVEMSGWPDYVFSKNYTLPSLKETEAHIKANGRLPGIPSAKEAESGGIDLGSMNKKLLQKIEELTLYLIEERKLNTENQEKLKEQKNLVSELGDKFTRLMERFEKLEKANK